MRSIVHVVRHGEVDNPEGVLYGRLPGFSLSEYGRQQAQQVAQWLSGRDISYLGVSPLQRAQETAAPIAEVLDIPVCTDPDLIEAENTFQGQKGDIRLNKLLHPRNWYVLRNPFRPSWGEPYDDIAMRMLQAVEKARMWNYQQAPGSEAVLVSHQLPIWVLRLVLSNKRLWHDPRNRECSLASVTSLHYEGSKLVHIHYNEPADSSDPMIAGA